MSMIVDQIIVNSLLQENSLIKHYINYVNDTLSLIKKENIDNVLQ